MNKTEMKGSDQNYKNSVHKSYAKIADKMLCDEEEQHILFLAIRKSKKEQGLFEDQAIILLGTERCRYFSTDLVLASLLR